VGGLAVRRAVSFARRIALLPVICLGHGTLFRCGTVFRYNTLFRCWLVRLRRRRRWIIVATVWRRSLRSGRWRSDRRCGYELGLWVGARRKREQGRIAHRESRPAGGHPECTTEMRTPYHDLADPLRGQLSATLIQTPTLGRAACRATVEKSAAVHVALSFDRSGDAATQHLAIFFTCAFALRVMSVIPRTCQQVRVPTTAGADAPVKVHASRAAKSSRGTRRVAVGLQRCSTSGSPTAALTSLVCCCFRTSIRLRPHRSRAPRTVQRYEYAPNAST
jgi:hypothetical protein